jgi:HAMP domain-containing protein
MNMRKFLSFLLLAAVLGLVAARWGESLLEARENAGQTLRYVRTAVITPEEEGALEHGPEARP